MKINRMITTLFLLIFSIVAQIDCSRSLSTSSTYHVATTDLRSITSDVCLRYLEIVRSCPLSPHCIPYDDLFPHEGSRFCLDRVRNSPRPNVMFLADKKVDSNDPMKSDKRLCLELALVSLLHNYSQQSCGRLRQPQEETVQEAMAQGRFMFKGMWEAESFYPGMDKLRVALSRVSLYDSEKPLNIDRLIRMFPGSSREREVKMMYEQERGRYANTIKELLRDGLADEINVPFEIVKLLVDGFVIGSHTKEN